MGQEDDLGKKRRGENEEQLEQRGVGVGGRGGAGPSLCACASGASTQRRRASTSPRWSTQHPPTESISTGGAFCSIAQCAQYTCTYTQ